jgi:hypothetical protein
MVAGDAAAKAEHGPPSVIPIPAAKLDRARAYAEAARQQEVDRVRKSFPVSLSFSGVTFSGVTSMGSSASDMSIPSAHALSSSSRSSGYLLRYEQLEDGIAHRLRIPESLAPLPYRRRSDHHPVQHHCKPPQVFPVGIRCVSKHGPGRSARPCGPGLFHRQRRTANECQAKFGSAHSRLPPLQSSRRTSGRRAVDRPSVLD